MLDKTYRTNKLRETYPAEVTSRKDVHAKLKAKPTLSAERPEAGWKHHATAILSNKLPPLEERSNRKILLVERFLMPDARSSFDFYSLCNLWFYYDAEDKLVDVEWEWHTD